MKTLINHYRPLPSALALAIGIGAFASSASHEASAAVLSYGGTGYVTGGDEKMQGDTGSYLSGSDQYGEPSGTPVPSALVGRAFSSTTAFSPTSGYSGPTFYGGASVTSTDPTDNEGYHELSVANGGGGDSIHWRVDSNTGDTHSNHILVYFQKSAFESPWNGMTINSGNLAATVFQLHTGQISQAGPNDTALYWVLQDGSDFYVAQNPTLIAQNNPYSTAFSSITGWALYDPTLGLAALDFDETSTFSAHTFTDVQGVGFYTEHENGASQSHVDIDYFALVPEPSHGILTLVGATMLILRRRRPAP